MGLIGIDPEALALPPQQQAAAMHICSLDERAWFDRSMVLEAQAASSNPNPNPNPKPNPDPNPNPNPNPNPKTPKEPCLVPMLRSAVPER